MLSSQQLAARKHAEKQRRIKMLCARLDRHVIAAEKLKRGATRAAHLLTAEKTRAELRKLDH